MSDQINHVVNNSKMGYVTRSYERVKDGSVRGSTAKANSGYIFVNWTDAQGNEVSNESTYIPAKTDPATYTANFKAKESNLTVHYEDNKGNSIKEDKVRSIPYGEEWEETAEKIQGYKLPNEITQKGTKKDEDEEITFVYTQKEGKVVYNLGPSGSWGNNGNPENTYEYDASKGKWAYNYGFDKGDTFVVTNKTPISSDNAVFVGWYDKKCDDSAATMRTANEKITYPYTESSKTNTYTLDALWEKLNGENKTVTYDGKKHSLDAFTVVFANTNLSGWTDSASSLIKAENIQYRVKQDGKEINGWGEMPSFTDAGEYIIEAQATVNNVPLTASATLTILKRDVTLKSADLEKVYDGTALVNGDTALETEEGWAEGEGATYSFTGTQTTAGSSDNAFTYTLKDNTKKGNYSITKKVGTLTVTKQSIVPDPEQPETYKGITISDPKDKVYNGKDQTWVPEVKDANGNALDASFYTVTYDKEDRTNVTGEIKVTIKGAKNYKGEVTKTYKITKRPVTLKSADLEKVYDGTALVNGDTALETEEGWAEGEGATYSFTGTQTTAGSSDNAFTYTLKDNTKKGNYDITKTEGTLKVIAKSIVPDGPDTPEEKKTGIKVSDPSDSKYDGKEHREVLTVKDTKTDKKLVADKDYTVTYSDDLVNAGTVTIKVAGLGNYTGSFEKTYKITKRSVTLTSANATKTYDGTALTNTSITVSGDGFVEGEGAEYKVTGTQTQVGNSANEFEYTLNANTLASNYNITKVVGTLTITAVPAPVTPPTNTTPNTPERNVPQFNQNTSTEEVKKEKTAKAKVKEEKVEEAKTPKAKTEKFWALINLISAIVTVLFGLLLLISKRHKSEDEEDETEDQSMNNDEEKEQEKKRGLFTRVLAVLIAIASVVFFLVTEDMSLDWTWTDQWTIWMVVLGIVQIVVFFIGRKWKNVDNDEDDEQAQQA